MNKLFRMIVKEKWVNRIFLIGNKYKNGSKWLPIC
jgi:hypothetical protein